MSQMIVNGINVGQEQQLLILSNPVLGTIPFEQLAHRTEFNAKQEATQVISTPTAYNGLRFHRNIYHDWSGTISADRFNNNFTALILRIMQIFQTTGAETYFSLFTQIANTAAGTIDELQFNQIVLDQHDAGKFTTGKVEQSIAFRCQSLTITGTNNNTSAQSSATGVIITP